LARKRWLPRRQSANGTAVIGFFETASGLGSAARGLFAALDSIRPTAISVARQADTPPIPGWVIAKPFNNGRLKLGFDPAVHVYNPDVFLGLVRQYGGSLLLPNRRNVAVINWETQRLPASWPAVLSLYDVLVAPSVFTAQAIRKATGRPVHVLPNHVPLRPVRTRMRSDGHFNFLCVFDAHSDFERKNPLAAVRSFRLAKGSMPRGISCRLQVKCHRDTPLGLVKKLKAEAGDAAVDILSETLSEEGMEHLWQACDCLVSLHRSEGFGLAVAESLARGIPVVTTRQGGVLDFVDDRTALLIDGIAGEPSLGGVADGYGEWSGWIDPDINAAVCALQRVVSDYPAESARARVGRERLGTYASQEAVVKAYRAAVCDG